MLKPIVMTTISVTTAGTRQQVSATSIGAYMVRFESVAGTIYVGDSTVSATKYMVKLTAGVGHTITGHLEGGPNAGSFNLANFYVDSAGNADKCQVTYFQYIDNA